MKKILLSLGMLCLLENIAFSQNSFCGTVAPANVANVPVDNAARTQPSQNPSAGVKVLPVVFHVFHSLYTTQPYGVGANVLHQQLVDMLNVTNTHLRKQNADTSLIPLPFRAAAADCEVELCLAQVDQNGNTMYEPGVDRFNCQSYGIVQNDFININLFCTNYTPLFVWDQTKYLNIWILPNYPSNASGMAYFPDSSGLAGLGNSGILNRPEDGIYVACFVANGTSSILAHEVGHFLGLLHTWGFTTGCDSDYCTDTPTATGPNSGCPVFPHITCANGPDGDMFTNYMDYSADSCKHQFTYDQKARMQTALINSPRRRELPFSTVCSPGPPQSPVAAFSNTPGVICPGQTIQFYDFSGFQPTSWSWSFPGGTPSSSTAQHPVVTYNSPGTYGATLTVTNAQGANSVTMTQIITVISPGPFPAFADFENGLLPPSDFQLITIPFTNPQPTWAIGNASGYGIGQKSLRQYSWYLHPIRSYLMDFSNSNMPTLSFDYAIAEGSLTLTTLASLEVQVSTDCGVSFTTVLLIPDSLAKTAPNTPNFVPNATQWRTATADLSAYGGMQDVYVQIIGNASTDWVYIDNINLFSNPLGVNQMSAPGIKMNVFPNPSTGISTLTVTGIEGKSANLSLIDISGRSIGSMNVKEGENKLDFGMTVSPGIYFLSLATAEGGVSITRWVIGN
jgi:PKD repeat protein